MEVNFRFPDSAHLRCEIRAGAQHAEIETPRPGRALDGLTAALDDLTLNGSGECFWELPQGVYRWLFRQKGDQLTLALTWSAGVVTGWEYILWVEGPCTEWSEILRNAIQRIQAPDQKH